MPTRRKARGSKGRRLGRQKVKPVNYPEGDNDDIGRESENDTNEEESVKSKEKTPLKSSPVKRSPVKKKNIKNGANPEKRKIDGSESDEEMDDEEEATVNITMPSRWKSTGSRGQRSGRQKVKPVNYSEGENDENNSDVSDSENDTDEEDSVKSKEKTPLKNSPVKRSPVKKKNMKNGANPEKKKIDDSESDEEMDDEEEATVNITTPSRWKSTGSRGQRSGRQKVKPVNYSEGENDENNSDVSDSENDTDEEDSVKSKERTPAGKQNKNKREESVKKTGRRGRKTKSSESEDDEIDDDNEERFVSREKTSVKSSPVKRKNIKNGANPEKRKIDDSESDEEMDDEEATVNITTPSRWKSTGSRGRRSGRQKVKPGNYSEGENDEDNSDVSDSENDTDEEDSVKSKEKTPLKSSPVKRSPVKKKNMKNGANPEKRKIDDSESDEEMDDEEEATVNITMPSRWKSTGSRGRSSGRQKMKPVNYSEDENDEDNSDVSDSENDTDEEESVKSKERRPAGKQNKNKREESVKKTGRRGRKTKSSESEDDEIDDDNEESFVSGVNIKTPSRWKSTGSRGRSSGRQKMKPVNYSEGENDENNSDVSDSENDTDEEDSVKSKEKILLKSSPVKRKNMKNGRNLEKRKIDDSESDEEMDDEEEATVNITTPSRWKSTGSRGRRSGRQKVKPVNYSEDENDEDNSDVSDSENDTDEEESVKSKERRPAGKQNKNKREESVKKTGRRGRKSKSSESEDDEIDDDNEESFVSGEKTPVKSSPVKRSPVKSTLAKLSPVTRKNMKNGANPEKRKIDDSESDEEMDDEEEETTVNITTPSRRKAPGSKGRRSGRQKVKPVNYSEGENDEDNSDVSDIIKIIEVVSADRQLPQKRRPAGKQNKNKREESVKKTGRRGRKTKSSESEDDEIDDDNEESFVSGEKTPVKSSPVKRSPVKSTLAKLSPVKSTPVTRKNMKNGANPEKRKIDDSESDEEMDDEEEETTETSSPKKSSKGANPKKSPAEKQKKKLRIGDGEKCLICNRTTMIGINYGVENCRNCKTFFARNSAHDGEELTCRVNDSCDLDSTKHTSICPSCRYQKCVELGMNTEEETTEGSRKSVRIVSLENKYKESDEDEDDIYLPFTKKKRRPNYYERSDSEIDESDDGDDPNDVDWNPYTRMTLEQVSYKKPSKRKVCAVCKSLTTPACHYGLNTCAYCSETFRKALNNIYVPRCISKNRKCDVKGGKSKCRFCTISRYLDLYMEANPIMENGKYKEKVERLEEVLYSDNPQKLALQKNPCKICGTIAEGVFHGVSSCHCCAAFFRNCLKGKGKLNPKKFVCPKNEICRLNRGKDPVKYKSNFCKDCRYKKCLKMGMTTDKQPADE